MRRSSALRLGLLGLIWGSSFAFIKLGLEAMSPTQIVLGRLTLGAIVLLAVVRVRRVVLPRGRGTWAHLVVLGLVGAVVPYFLFGWAEQRVPSALAGLLNGSTPLFTALLAVVVLPDERLTPRRSVGLALGFAGVVLVVGPDAVAEGLGGASVLGQLACLAASACYGIALVYSRRVLAPRIASSLSLATGQMIAASSAMLLLAPLVAATPVAADPVAFAAVGALGLLGTGVAYLLFFRVLVDEGATTASLVTYAVPVVAVALGVVFLGEPLTWNLLAGAAVVVAGVAVMELRRAAPAGATPAVPDAAASAELGVPVPVRDAGRG